VENNLKSKVASWLKIFALQREAGAHLFSHIPLLQYATMTQTELGQEKLLTTP
jgi:hypothetical protein